MCIPDKHKYSLMVEKRNDVLENRLKKLGVTIYFSLFFQ